MESPGHHIETRKRVAAALTDSTLSVGHEVEFVGRVYLNGGMEKDGPQLSPVFVDELGRFWKEFSNLDENKLVCILDLRDLTHAINSRAA